MPNLGSLFYGQFKVAQMCELPESAECEKRYFDIEQRASLSFYSVYFWVS